MFLDVEQAGYLLMRLLFEDIQVEHRPATVGQLGHKLHQHFFGQVASAFGYRSLVYHVGQLLFIDHQLGEALLPPQVVDGLGHHYARHPRGQRAFAPKAEVGEDFDETVVQHIMGFVHIARIAIAHGQHLAGIKGVQLFPSSIVTCPTSFNQLYFTILYQNLCTDASSRRLSVRRSIWRNAANQILKRS